MNIPRSETAEFRFFNNIYRACVERVRIQGFFNLDRGIKVLSDEIECDRYLAFYGGHHFYKLYEAFNSTNFRSIEGANLEVFDWGCGQAVATCILIDYLIEKGIHPNFVSITLIEPSYTALQRGYYFTRRILENRHQFILKSRQSTSIFDLTPSDIISQLGNLKLHLFSNILDVEGFDLYQLYRLMNHSFQGTNRVICTSPKNHRYRRLVDFYQLFAKSRQIYNCFETSEPIQGEVFYFRTGHDQICSISRYEKQFTVKLPKPSNGQDNFMTKAKVASTQGNLFLEAELNQEEGFDGSFTQNLNLPDAEVVFYKNFFTQEESDEFFRVLRDEIKWRQDTMKIYGKEVDLPRKTAWYGDSEKSYSFSGIHFDPEPWTPSLLSIKEKIKDVVGVEFNSVLLNLYRDGSNYISWHTDAEAELGKNPTIGSVSFGGSRKFEFRHKNDKNLKSKIELTHGSFLLMAGTTQHFWQHQIPKTAKKVEPRINLTFRVIQAFH